MWYSLQFAVCSLKLVCSAAISEREQQFVEVIFSPLYQYFTDGLSQCLNITVLRGDIRWSKFILLCPCKEVLARDNAELNSSSPPSTIVVFTFLNTASRSLFSALFTAAIPSFLCARTMHPVPSCGARVRQGAPPTFVIIHVQPFYHTLVKMSMFADKIVCNRKCLLSCCTVFQDRI